MIANGKGEWFKRRNFNYYIKYIIRISIIKTKNERSLTESAGAYKLATKILKI